MESIQGKTIIISGGASGIGLGIAEALIAEGANLVLTSRRTELLEQEAARLSAIGPGRAIGVGADVRNKQQVQEVAQAALRVFGGIDGLINNSGLGVGDSIESCSEENWDLVMDTCAKGTFLMTQAVLPNLRARQSGHIINIASQAAKNGYANAGPYCAAKFAVLGFAAALQEEVRGDGIKVHSLCPGLVQVPRPHNVADQSPGWLQVEDMAAAVLYVLKQPKRVFLENIGLYGF
ncbi:MULTISPECIES: SDR family oxidoreductase [Corallincola]|uniref:SDR family NAD(P)-dependent oxidoreductase n=3 Tax=Corallincola TaxID=1775176 RepID=A0A368NKX8_9GAMM|nr:MULTISPECIES: SDR family oxidoreductase [Corallincola]RCU50294.1 SDR family NAD(P)-dependent oxidoreductase [Corallincola holothuriorum]TAA48695.1 SDR family oxidoreductase [Corallincola spongiicola]TCI05446.1 SDR family oxidoreductase [Corallincola luteus]